MKKLCLLIALVASPVFAQEEEQDIQIEIETGGGLMKNAYLPLVTLLLER